MSDHDKLLALAFSRFVEAKIPVEVAKYGIVGIWIGPPVDDETRSENEPRSSLHRAERACALWSQEYHLPNPYEPIVEFLRAGGSFRRWENNILDVEFPDGTVAGIPLATFVIWANTPLQSC